MGNGDVLRHVTLAPSDVAFLKRLISDLPILADVCRADLTLFCRARHEQAITVAWAGPHSVSPVYEERRIGMWVGAGEQPEVMRTLAGHPNPRAVTAVTVRGANVARQVYPVRNARGQIIAALVADAYWLAHERHRRRSKAFQQALSDFTAMVLRGELVGGSDLTPFGEHDGIVYVGADRRIQYMSGVAAGLYRHLGYRDSLVGRRVSELETVDPQMVSQALTELRCLERQDEQYGLTWLRRALPVTAPDQSLLATVRAWFRADGAMGVRPRGVLLLIRDITEALETQRELESKLAMIREVHHRVKNNLQVIASLMRMQARRLQGEEARTALEESVNRILSVAVVHEFLSQNAQGTINLQEVAHRILSQVQQGLVDPSKRIKLRVRGADIWLPAERATQCALVVNELVQNAIEHGIAGRDEGSVEVELVDEGDHVSLVVADDGLGLPAGFDLGTNSNLGLRIVRSMIERDLRGTFTLQSDDGTRAVARFEKSMLGGG